MKRLVPLVLCVSFMLFCGCGKNVSLSGKVTFSDDASPLTVGIVCFEDSKLCATGPLNSSGQYVVGTEKAGNGLPPGTYRVYIIDAGKDGEPVMRAGQDGEQRAVQRTFVSFISPKYISPETSGLSVTVNASTKTFDVKVDRPPASK